MGKLAESVKTTNNPVPGNKPKRTVLRKKETPNTPIETKEKPILQIKTTKSLFPELKVEEIMTDSGRITRKGIVYKFYRHNKDKTVKPIIDYLETSIKDKSLFGIAEKEFISNQFDKVCIKAMEKAGNGKDKITCEDLVKYIQSRMEEVKTILFNNLSLLDI